MLYCSKICYHITFQDPKVSGAGGASALQIRAPIMLLLLLIGNLKLPSNCTVFSTKFVNSSRQVKSLTLNLLTTTVVAPPNNASKWQMGFNSAFKGLSGTHTKKHVAW